MMFWWFQLCQWWCFPVVVLEGKGENRNYLYLSDTSSSDVRISMESNPRSADGQTRIRIRPESDQTQNCVIGSFHWKPACAEDEWKEKLKGNFATLLKKKNVRKKFTTNAEMLEPKTNDFWHFLPIFENRFILAKEGRGQGTAKSLITLQHHLSSSQSEPFSLLKGWNFFLVVVRQSAGKPDKS